jgi:CRISPR/Cas system-associated endonuclease/helicase Cas3
MVELNYKTENQYNDDSTSELTKVDFNDFKQELIESLIEPRIELKTKNCKSLSIIRNQVRPQSAACCLQ